MMNSLPMILGIIDTIYDWNDKLKAFADEHLGGVGMGTILFLGILAIAILGMRELNKKQ